MANSKVWLHCYNCGEQFHTEVSERYSSKQICGECRKPKPQIEQTECYQCDTEIQAEVGQVHPLCEECQLEFDDWFAHELGAFKNV